MNIKKQLGAKIKRLRIKHNYTQEQLAEKIGIATRTLCGIENGENFVKSETLEKFCIVFGVGVSEIFSFDHLKPCEELKDEIISDLKNINDRNKIENIYKFVKCINIE